MLHARAFRWWWLLAGVTRATRAAGVVVLALSGACEQRRATSCRFGAEHALFRSSGSAFDGMALVPRAHGAVAFFSEVTGVFAQALDEQARPSGAALHLAASCDGGLDALADAEGFVLACLRPAHEPSGAAAAPAVSVYHLDAALQLRSSEQFGQARRLSHGVALAQDATGLHCAWQDAAVGDARVWHAALGAGEPALRVVSDSQRLAGAPTLCTHHGAVFGAWAELEPEALTPRGRVVLRNLHTHAAPQTLVTTREAAASPSVVSLGEGLVVAFRDHRARSRKTGLYLLRVDAQLQPIGRPVRVARADGVAQPAVRVCAGSIVAATPRSFAGDYFVGVVQVAAALDRMSGEQQFYEDSHEFAQAAAACSGPFATLLIGERGRLGHSGAAVRAVPLACR